MIQKLKVKIEFDYIDFRYTKLSLIYLDLLSKPKLIKYLSYLCSRNEI